MLLVSLEVLHDVLLLAQLRVEELRVRLELIGESLVGLVQELGLVADSLEESIIDLSLDVVVVVLSFIVHVVLECLIDLLLKLALL